MQTIRLSIFVIMAAAMIARAQEISKPGWFTDTRFTGPVGTGAGGKKSMPQTAMAEGGESFSLLSSESESYIAEAITPEIAAVARNLENDPKRIYDFVHDHIRYEHYFGSKKGAHLTWLERSGNDFDQNALLVALLLAAGHTNVTYQFGTVIMPYETTDHQDFRHWVGASKPNTIWDDPVIPKNGTIWYISTLNARGGFPYTNYAPDNDTNKFAFHHLWVQLSLGGTNYLLDPSFKVSEPIQGIDLSAAMGLSTNDLLNAAATGATNTADYVQNLNETALRGKLTDYTTNLLAYLQANYPNASAEEILGGHRIVSSASQPLGAPLPYEIYDSGQYSTSIQWTAIPTLYMSILQFDFDPFGETVQSFYLPELQGRRLSLTFNTNGLAQLWLEDEELLEQASDGASTLDVYHSVEHPHAAWSFTYNTLVGNRYHSTYYEPVTYARTNASYSLLYGFTPGPEWQRERQERLDAYLNQGLAATSREVQTETLNVIGLSWLAQTELAHRALCLQNLIPIRHHRLGRTGQVSGGGNSIDVPFQWDGNCPASGILDADVQRAYQTADLNGYFFSALEGGILDQLQPTGVPAACTIKLLQLANTNGQALYVANSNNWTTGANVRSQLVNYNLNSLDDLINGGSYLFLPQNGSNHLGGSGSWAGYGMVDTKFDSISRNSRFLISGDYNGGYSGELSPLDPIFLWSLGLSQSSYFYPANPFLPTISSGDPVRMVDAAFHLDSTDLSLGQREPRGISFSRHYSPTRRHHNLANMANGWVHNYSFNLAEVSASLQGLGTTTPAQMAPMLVATRAALALYQTQPDPKNWLTTTLIVKWGIDQLLNNSVAIMLGNNTIQFIKQPDGSFTPPASCKMTLSKTNSAYALQERHGNRYNFSTNHLLSSITDQYGQALTLAYNGTNGLLQTVTDWKNRSLTLNYAGSPLRLSSVSDSAGRSVSYGYTTNYNTQGDLTSVTDPEQKTRTFIYDMNHQLLTTKNALNQIVVSNVYDGFGRVMTQYTLGDTNKTWQLYWSGWETVEQDPAGGKRRFFFDDHSRLVGLQDALGNLSQTFYDGQDHTVMTISPLNETNRFIYDGNHNLIYAIDPLGYTNQFVYDNQSNLTRTVDARGNTNFFGYNTKFQLIASTNAMGNWVTNGYNSADGTLSTRVDAGGTTSYVYDTYGQLSLITYPGSLGSEGFLNSALGDVLSRTNARSFVTSLQYNLRRQLTNSVAPTNLTAKVVYDPVGNVSTTTDARGFSTTNTWSATQKLMATTLPSTPQGVPVITNIYDPRDWLSRTLNPLQHATLYTNDAAGKLLSVTDPALRTMSFGYDVDGRRTSTTNAALEVTKQAWSVRGELSKLTDPATNIVSSVYDGVGNQITLTNRNGKRWQFQFDAANRLTNTITPLNRQTQISYNNRGLVETVKEPSGQMATNYYDPKSRLTNRVDTVGSTVYRLDANNNVTNIVGVPPSGGPATNAWTFDAYDRVSTYKDADGNLMQYRYDANGNMTNLVYPGNKTVKYLYDSLNRLTNVTDWASRQTTFTYDLANRVKTISRQNGTQRIINYDAAGQTTNIIEQTSGGNVIAFFKLNWNNAARVQWEFGAPLPHACTPPNRTMTFDDDNRLATFNGSTITNDLDGNMTWGPGTNNTLTSYCYDARNRLLSGGGLSYAYDALGNRTALTNGASVTKFVINPNARLSQVLMRVNSGVTNYYVYGLGLLYEADDSGSTKTYHYDYRGSTVALTDGSGNVTDRVEYDAYATTTYRSGSTDTPFLFNGRYGVQTDANGLLYMRARYYNPYICRFLNPDPAGFSGGLNSYAYADGNPISLVDPFGLWTWGEVGSFAGNFIAGVAVGAAVAVIVVVAAPVVASVGAAALVAAGVSAATATTISAAAVTTGIAVTAVAGTVATGYNTYQAVNAGDWDAVAFNAGGLVGGLAVGVSGGGRALAEGIMGKPSPAPNTWNPLEVVKYERSAKYQSDYPDGSFLSWMATAPTPASGGVSAALTAAGVSSFFQPSGTPSQ